MGRTPGSNCQGPPNIAGLPPLPPPPTLFTGGLEAEKAAASNTNDSFRCVWCRDTFSTLTQLTTHLKEAKHGEKEASKKSQTSGGSTKSEKGPTPRKLVRGQDVWLGKGEEQTRQILKCMWCGQSFRSLADLTTHMSETKHYTKVIPQEQLSTWRAQQQQQQSQQRGSDSPSNCSTPSPLPNQNSPVSTNLHTYLYFRREFRRIHVYRSL